MPITIPGIERDLKENRRVTVVRERLFILRSLEMGRSKKSLSLELGICERTLSRWQKRYRVGGAKALHDQVPELSATNQITKKARDGIFCYASDCRKRECSNEIPSSGSIR